MMDRKTAVRAVVVVAAVGVIVATIVGERRRATSAQPSASAIASGAHDESAHAKGIDWAMAPLSAPFDAPEGATPCETAYIGFKAAVDAAKANGRPPLFSFLAEKDDFLAKCAALPKEAQTCMQPRYIVHHRDECARVRPPQPVLDAMFRSTSPQEAPK